MDRTAENRELRRRTKQLEQENEILRRATAYFVRDAATAQQGGRGSRPFTASAPRASARMTPDLVARESTLG